MTTNKVLELRKAIVSALRPVHPRVFHRRAPKGTAYPYLVYNLPNSMDDGSFEQFVLDVDGWDSPEDGDSTILETLMHEADRALHGLTVSVGTSLSMVFYRDRRLSLDDDDPNIVRRTYIYQARIFGRG